MPNWCMNTITLSGPQTLLKSLVEDGFTLEKLIPCPKELEGTLYPTPDDKASKALAKKNVKKYGAANWYDWKYKNWGTKWDISAEIIDECYYDEPNDSVVDIRFDSAWSPPVEAMHYLYNKYKAKGLNIAMEYFEPGAAYLGKVSTNSGKFVDEYREYKTADELDAAVKELDHDLASNEVEYMRESDAEIKALEEDMKKNSAKKPTVKKLKKK
jgi:hypothetical protein